MINDKLSFQRNSKPPSNDWYLLYHQFPSKYKHLIKQCFAFFFCWYRQINKVNIKKNSFEKRTNWIMYIRNFRIHFICYFVILLINLLIHYGIINKLTKWKVECLEIVISCWKIVRCDFVCVCIYIKLCIYRYRSK